MSTESTRLAMIMLALSSVVWAAGCTSDAMAGSADLRPAVAAPATLSPAAAIGTHPVPQAPFDETPISPVESAGASSI